LDLDGLDEREHLYYAVQVVKAFAQIFISDRLQLTERLYLVRQKHNDVPVFLDSETISGRGFSSVNTILYGGPAMRRGLTGRAKGPLFRH